MTKLDKVLEVKGQEREELKVIPRLWLTELNRWGILS